MKICFIDYSTALETVRDLFIKPRGGMVQSLFKITDYLSKIGHDVTVLSDIKRPDYSHFGTNWTNEPPEKCDILVCNRGTGDGYSHIDAKARILWTHDLPHSGFIPDPKTIRAFNYTVFMSNYAERIWRTFYKNIGKSVIIPNGVDKTLWRPGVKNLHKAVYFSHPNRGLKRLQLIADAIRTRTDDRFTLHAFSGTSMYPLDKDERDHSTETTYTYQAETDALRIQEPLPARRIAREVAEAGLCILPSGYPEICSNAVLQSLACGTPVITTGGLGATPEWVKHRKNGMLTKFQPHDYMTHTVEIVRNAVEVLENERFHRKLINGAKNTKIYDWSEIGAKWNKLLSKFC